jgi:serine phosphatase RsbU (regulator of sigma subunit)
VLAVRYSCTASAGGAARVLMGDTLPAGFAPSLADAERATAGFNRNSTITAVATTSFIGVLSAFGLLHLFLYLFDRRERANLLYSLFAFCFALNSACGLLLSVTHLGYEETAFTAFANRVFVAGIFVFFLAFLYAAFKFPVPKYYWAIVAVWVLAVLGIMAVPLFSGVVWVFPFAIFISITGFMYTFGQALRHRIDGAWIIGAGAQSLAFALIAQLVSGIFGFAPTAMQFVTFFGFIGLPVCISVYLARAHARTGRHLEAKLEEVERLSAEAIEHERREAVLEAENARRAEELEEARQLQLSMLPAAVPDLPGLEIAAYMKPATEVGGDYYDFHVAEDGTLTVAVGDATGHGLKAGTLVTATKGLFNAFAEEPDIPRFFRRSSRALKLLNLRYLYMALMLVKVKGSRVRLSAAGMPPALVYRAATGEVEEVAIRGLPLGGAAVFPYEEREIELAPGDVVVLMSDGFPERFNASGEMLDYGRAREVLVEVADEGPREIIEHFVRTADAWADGHPQNDDVTFVVLKVRDAAR